MQHIRLIALFIIALSYLAIQSAKNASFLSPKTSNIRRLNLNQFENQLYHRVNTNEDSETKAFLEKQRSFRVASAGTFKESIEIESLSDSEKKNAVATTTEEKSKELTDDKKKKAAQKKKDDKKSKLAAEKEKGLAKEYAQTLEAQKIAQKTAPDRWSAMNSNSEVYGVGSLPVADSEEDKQNKKDAIDIEFWTKTILANPSDSTLTDFLRAFQSNEISEVAFYAVLQNVIENGSSSQQLFVAKAAGVVQSLRSFDLLIDILSAQPFASPVAATAQQSLNGYSQWTGLGVIKQVMGSALRDEKKVEAATLALRISTEKYISGADITNLRPQQIQFYLSFLPHLSSIIEQFANNPNVTQYAQQSFEAINQLSTLALAQVQ